LIILFPLALIHAGLGGQNKCDASAVFQHATEELSSHQFARAAHSLDEIRDCSTLTPVEVFQVGWLYGRARRFDLALQVFGRMQESVPDLATHQFAGAPAHFELG
jgi:hypothetical protein